MLLWRNPLPGETFLSQLYGPEYYGVLGNLHELQDQVGVSDTIANDKKFRDDISPKVVQSWIDLGVQPQIGGRPGKLLEIGGGRGYLQLAAERRGWDTIGLETSPHAIQELQQAGLEVLTFPLSDLRNKAQNYNEYFDVIVFYDFLEHLPDPSQTLRIIRSVLKSDGTIICRVPNTIGTPKLHLADHIWHFSTRTLPNLLAKEGFQVTHAHHSGRFVSTRGDYLDNMTVFSQKCDSCDWSVKQDIVLEPNPLGL